MIVGSGNPSDRNITVGFNKCHFEIPPDIVGSYTNSILIQHGGYVDISNDPTSVIRFQDCLFRQNGWIITNSEPFIRVNGYSDGVGTEKNRTRVFFNRCLARMVGAGFISTGMNVAVEMRDTDIITDISLSTFASITPPFYIVKINNSTGTEINMGNIFRNCKFEITDTSPDPYTGINLIGGTTDASENSDFNTAAIARIEFCTFDIKNNIPNSATIILGNNNDITEDISNSFVMNGGIRVPNIPFAAAFPNWI